MPNVVDDIVVSDLSFPNGNGIFDAASIMVMLSKNDSPLFPKRIDEAIGVEEMLQVFNDFSIENKLGGPLKSTFHAMVLGKDLTPCHQLEKI